MRELVIRDVILRYRGSALGFVWTLLYPLLFMGVYTLVFSVFLHIGAPNYAILLIAGLLPWQCFATSVQAGTGSMIEGRMYIGKTVIAPVVLVLVPVLSNFVQFLLSLPILFAIAVILHFKSAGHVQVGWPTLVLPLLLGIQLLLTFGLLLFLATFNVFYRDVQQLVGVILMLAFFLTPIVYPLSTVPAQYRSYLLLNPMAPLVLGYQDIFYYHSFPNFYHVSYALGAAVILTYFGAIVFKRYKDTIAEYV